MIPRATYRIQFGKQFRFDDAAAIAPYLAALGISHVYASPYLQSRPDSKHGYDITDHNALNRELGDEHGFRRMLQAFHDNHLQHILDYVPNHMGVGGADNPFWLEVLEWGQESRYAGWFDVDWDSHAEFLNNKLLVPFLAEQYGAVLESGQFELRFDAQKGEFSVWLYGPHKLPVTPPSYARILDSETLALDRLADEFAALPEFRLDIRRRADEPKAQLADCAATSDQVSAALATCLQRFRGTPGELHSWDRLDSLIRKQHGVRRIFGLRQTISTTADFLTLASLRAFGWNYQMCSSMHTSWFFSC
jgi:(1->4)-alpha-D-glucan 1-alpha-D-glucosylmutase